MKPDKNLLAIKNYLHNGEDINLQQERMMERYQIAFAIYLDQKTKTRTKKILMNYFQCNAPTALMYINKAEYLFGNVPETTDAMKRHIATEVAIEVMNKARATRNLDQMNKALANYIKANGLHLDKPEVPDFNALKIPEEPIVIEFEFLKKYSNVIDKTVLDKIKAVLKEAKVYQYLEDAEEVSFFEEN